MHEKKCLYIKKCTAANLLWWRVRLGRPGAGVNFSLKRSVNPGPSRYHIHMTSKRMEQRPLKVGGESMLMLLRGVQVETLEQIIEDLRPVTFANHDLVRTVERVLESRKSYDILEEGDTISMDMEQ